MRPLRTAKTSLADSTQKPQVRPQRDPRARQFISRHDFGQESHLLAVDRKLTFLQCQAYENTRDRALKGLVKMPVNIVQPLLNFYVFSLADKGKKGNSVSFIVHFKTLQDSSALESLEHFIFQVHKISRPMTLTDPVHRTVWWYQLLFLSPSSRSSSGRQLCLSWPNQWHLCGPTLSPNWGPARSPQTMADN